MNEDGTRPGRREEIEAILERKPGVVEVRDEADRYTVVGAAGRETYANWLTPITEHFVCHRNPIPEVDSESWSITLSGLDEPGVKSGSESEGESISLSLAALRDEHPTVAISHTMECAGNGRGQHDPETGSVQWGFEAVATAVWTGTPLRSVLRAHGVRDIEDRWLTAIGADSIESEVFARSIPLEKAMDDCILAYGMNGEILPTEHGYPLRLIVPGWYGVNNVKWLDELLVADSMVTEGSLDRPGTHARWQQTDYRILPVEHEASEHETVGVVNTESQLRSEHVESPYTFDETVMSLIATPDETARLVAGEPVEILGVAWAGDDWVEGVEISTDGGDTWEPTELFGPAYAGTWRLFSYDWVPEAGEYTLCSRATDDQGRRQPARISAPDEFDEAIANDQFPYNEGGYAANAYLPNAFALSVSPAE